MAESFLSTPQKSSGEQGVKPLEPVLYKELIYTKTSTNTTEYKTILDEDESSDLFNQGFARISIEVAGNIYLYIGFASIQMQQRYRRSTSNEYTNYILASTYNEGDIKLGFSFVRAAYLNDEDATSYGNNVYYLPYTGSNYPQSINKTTKYYYTIFFSLGKYKQSTTSGCTIRIWGYYN